MPRLPPVDMSPHTRLRARFAPAEGNSVVTFDQSHSSSSATSWARPVSVPCPISERAIRITTVSSGRMTTQALTSGDPSAARTTVGPNGTLKPSARPPVTAAEPTMKERRFIFMMAASGFRRGVDGFPDLLESAATADVAHRVVDIGVGRLGLVLEQRRGGHDHSRLAVAALRNVVLEPRLLHLGQHAVGGETFDGGDLFSL